MKRKFPLYWLAMILFCLLGMLIGLFPGYRFSAGICFGIAALIGCFRLISYMGKTRPKLSKIFRQVLSLGLALLILAAAVTGFFIMGAGAGSPEEACDYLIVLGAGVNGTVPSLSLRERLDAAYDYLQAHPDTVCIVSGGQGHNEQISEAQCMFNELTRMGIDENRIWMEEQSTSTKENLRFSLNLIESRTGKRPAEIGLVSSEYHLFRAGLFAADEGVTSVGIPAKTSWISLRINYFLREIAGVWAYWVFGR